MIDWREATVAELCERVDYGYTASASEAPGLPRFLRITDIVGSHIDWRTVPGCEIDEQRLAKFRLEDGDIVVARTGATVGHAKRVRDLPLAVFASYLVRFRPARDIEPSFLGAAMESAAYKEWVSQNAGGAAQPNANAKTLGAFRLRIPDRSTQKRIGAIADAFEDLIENNRRRIELLEEMARAIYREWFVHFRYPGHEDVPLIETPVGPTPEGWRVTTVGEAFEVVLGGTPSRKKLEYWTEGTVPWVTSTRVNDLRVLEPSELITTEALRSCSARVMPKRTTLIAITGATLGQVSALEIEACANQSVVGVFDSDGVFSEYVYLWFKEHIASVISHASGSAQQHINKGTVLSTRLAIPPDSVVATFGSLARPMFDLIADLLAAQAELTAMRDLLLPKLMTGQIDLSRLDLDEIAEALSA